MLSEPNRELKFAGTGYILLPPMVSARVEAVCGQETGYMSHENGSKQPKTSVWISRGHL